MVILTSLLYFGFLLYAKMSIINAAREGAHYGILLDPTKMSSTAFTNAVSDQVDAAASVGVNTSQVTTTVTGLQVNGDGTVSTHSCSWGMDAATPCKQSTASTFGDAVTVTVTYPFANPVPLHLELLGNVIIDLPSSINLSSTVQMIHE